MPAAMVVAGLMLFRTLAGTPPMLRLVTLVLLTAFVAQANADPVPKSVKAKPPAREKIEPRPGEKLFSMKFDNLSLKKVVELLDEETGLLCTSEEIPDLRVTFYTENVCLAELFAQLNDELVPKGYLLARKIVSFNVLKVDAPLDRKCCAIVLSNELERWSPDEPVQAILPAFNKEGVDLGLKQAESITHKWFEVKPFKDNKLIVVGRAADVQQFNGKFSADIWKRIEADRETPQQLLERMRRGR